MLLDSWSIYENYTSPLGVGFVCRSSNHSEPAPDSREAFHHADRAGVGYDRTAATGSGYTSQYCEPVRKIYESLSTCPDNLLLFFHHVPYTYKLHSGETVIQHIYNSHYEGVKQAEGLRDAWMTLHGKIDEERYQHVLDRFDQQIEHAQKWRDSINSYFFQQSGIPDELGRLK
jgi:alpha-glucuronidase